MCRFSGRRVACWLIPYALLAVPPLMADDTVRPTAEAARALPDRARPPSHCPPLTALPAAPAAALRVTDFGARGDDDRDDTAAIGRALAALRPGQSLVFPPGRYLHDRRLPLRTRDVVLDGRGATLHATNPGDMALLVQADGVQIIGFTLTAATDHRRTAPWESRIAVWRPATERRTAPLLSGVVIRDNRLVPTAEDPNSSASAAIFVSGVRDFLVAGNTVVRSLSDGIHITGGARDGRVLGNTVRETGDDMIAVVSYLGDGMWTRGQTEELAATLQERRDDKLVRNVLIADNDVEGQYWGRGISVVGGEQVTIRANRIANTAHAAAVYVTREQVYVTFGVRDVRIEGNHIERVQTDAAPYNPLPLPQRLRKTGHGAIEIGARIFADEAAIPALREALTVERVAVVGNRVQRVRGMGVRINDGNAEGRVQRAARDLGGGRRGETIERESQGGVVRDVVVRDNHFAQLGAAAVGRLGGTGALRLACRGNRDPRGAVAEEACLPASVRAQTQRPAAALNETAPAAIPETAGALIDCR
jgi:hypothetical protein